MSNTQENQSISDIIDEVKAEVCDKICKWSETYGADAEDLLEKKCMEDCPMKRL